MQNNQISIELEEINSKRTWKNSFPAKEIEEMTRNIGSYTDIQTFHQMLNKAIQGQHSKLSFKIHLIEELKQMSRGQVKNRSISRQTPLGNLNANIVDSLFFGIERREE